ncbi:MAG: hypothetical protein P4K78_14705 [Terracidiphilus sp.]|nr:hypothetical protein [Terracidiphilus sp.]
MRKLVLGSLLSFACFAGAQQQQPPGDVYESGGQGAETPAQAVKKLYLLTAEMTDDPSSGYDAKTDHWPEADADWQQWDNSMATDGNALTPQQHKVLPACAAHLGAAIGDAERSYRIQKSQPNNPPAQATAQKLLATARKEFAQCNRADALNGSNGNPAPGGTGPGSQTGGTPGSGPGAPIPGGVSSNGPGGTPGGPQSPTPPGGKGKGGVNTPGQGQTPGSPRTPAPPGAPIPGGVSTGPNGTSGPSQNGTGTQPRPSNALTNTVDYVRGLIDGMGDGFKGFGNLALGAAFFAKGMTALQMGQGLSGNDFVNASKAWGLTPGDSIVLKGLAAEMNQQVVGSNVSAYDQGRTGGRRILNYAVAPAALEAAGPVLGARAPPGSTGANPLKGSAVAGESAANPLKGQAILDTTSGKTPWDLADKFIETGSGPVRQLGAYEGGGSFGQVYDLANEPRVIKLSTTFEDSAPSFPRQFKGMQRLQSAKVDTPKIDPIEPVGPGQPASLVMDNVKQKWPGAEQFTRTQFAELAETQYNQVLAAADQVYKKLVNKNLVGADLSINNMMFQPNGAGDLNAIVHDADMIFTMEEMEKEFSNAKSYPGNAVRTTLENDPSFEPFNETVESLMDKLFKANFPPYENRLPPPPPVNPGSGTLPSNPGTGTIPRSPGSGTLPRNPGTGTLPSNPGTGTVPRKP